MNRVLLRLISILTLFTVFFTFNVGPVLAARTYNYDPNGNMTSDGTNCYEYNEANQLKKVKNCGTNQTIAEYVYDYQGERIVKKEYENGALKNTVYSPDDEFEKKIKASDNSVQNSTYYKANDEVLAQKKPSGDRVYYHNDHLGSNSVSTDQNGAQVEKTSYEPYGEVKSGGTQAKFQYTGQEKDAETGLNYYGARYYDPHIHRFTQPDEIIQDKYDPQMLNRYAYVRNNPLRYTDPSGNFISTIIGAIVRYVVVPSVRILASSVLISPVINKVSNNPTIQKVSPMVNKVANTSAVQNVNKVISNNNIIGQNNSPQQIKSTLSTVGNIVNRYVRPSNATTKAQRQFVQGKNCVTCGKQSDKMVADHNPPLVQEYYETGMINIEKMKSLDAIRPQCLGCSRIQGGTMSSYSKQKIYELDL